MAERIRPGDDAAGDRPDDDEVLDDAIADDDELAKGGATAVARTKSGDDVPTARTDTRKVGFLGRIALFFREVVAELRKVIWPTRKELLTYTGVVIAFLTIMTTIVVLLDLGFARVVLWAFGNPSK